MSLSNLQKLFKLNLELTSNTLVNINESDDFNPCKAPRLLEQIYKMQYHKSQRVYQKAGLISHMYISHRPTICDLSSELMQETLVQFEVSEVDAKVKELRKKKRAKMSSRLMSGESKRTGTETEAPTPIRTADSPSKINDDSSDDEKQKADDEKKMIGMTLGKRREHEAKMKQLKEFAVIFKGMFKILVKD